MESKGKRNPFNKNKTRETTNCQKDEESEEVLNCLEDLNPLFSRTCLHYKEAIIINQYY